MERHQIFIFGRNVAITNANETRIFISTVSACAACTRHERSLILQSLTTCSARLESHHIFIFGINVAVTNVNETTIFISFVSTCAACNRHEKSLILQRLVTAQHFWKGARTSPLAEMVITLIRITLTYLSPKRPPLLLVRGTRTLFHAFSYISPHNIREATTP